jgi:hypothetical protein
MKIDTGHFDVMADLKDLEGRLVLLEKLLTRSMFVREVGFVVRVALLDDIIAEMNFANHTKDGEGLPELIAIQEREPS